MFNHYSRAMRHLCIGMLLMASGLSVSVRAADRALTVPDEIRAEALRGNDDPLGRPLPLASTWSVSTHPNYPGCSPSYQLDQIGKGHFILPALALPGPGSTMDDPCVGGFKETWKSYYEAPFRRLAGQRLPFAFISTQWESILSVPPYRTLPADRNPNVVLDNGTIQPRVCPFGPVDCWRKAGVSWTDDPLLKTLQQWYPNPSRIIFISNNEHPKLTWPEVESSERYLARYGKGRSDEFKRKVVAEGWIARYRALQDGLREGLTSSRWKKTAIFVGYDAFGAPALGRWPGWTEYTLHIPNRIDPAPLMWDGGSPSYYLNDWEPTTDYTVWSPQTQFQNLVFMQSEALRLNPKFWFEMSVWDGFQNQKDPAKDKRAFFASKGQSFTPARWAGFLQYGMWLVRPRVVRDYRGWLELLKDNEPYFLALVAAVDRVHTDPTLRAFWRKGELVANPKVKHPYQAAIPAEYQGADRWFRLDTSLDPKLPWDLMTDLKVLALALVQGKAPARQWLVYAHSPLADRQAVAIAVPGYKQVTIDVPVAGVFYRVDEAAGTVERVKPRQ